jgi:hypothetical protein
MKNSSLDMVRKTLLVMLRPIVRLCLRYGLGIQDLLEAMKVVLLGVAQEELERAQEKVNVSRLSVVTGLHRRDVTRIMDDIGGPTESVNLVSRVVTQWENSEEYLTKGGKPKTLSYEGEASEFSKLVKQVTKDIHFKGVLLQLERLNMVERTSHGLRLSAGAHDVRKDMEKGYHVLSQDLEDLSMAVEANISLEDDLPNLHARTEFDNIFVDALPEIRQWLLKEGSSFHQRARTFLSQFDRDVNPHIRNEAGQKVVITSFSRVVEPARDWKIASESETVKVKP